MSTPQPQDAHPAITPPPGGPEFALDEASAVARAQDGDLAAFEALVDRYQRPIFRLALRIVLDRGRAEDIVQETFVAAWRKLPTLQQPGAFRGWLYQVATRRSLDALRRLRPEAPFEEESPAVATAMVPRTGEDPASTVEHRAELDDLSRALAELPGEQRVCWTLKEFHGLSYAEIASMVDLPLSTVRGRIARARHTLAERMSSWR